MIHATCDLCGQKMKPGEGKPIRLHPEQFLIVEIKADGGVFGPGHICNRCLASFVDQWVAEVLNIQSVTVEVQP